MPVSEVLLDADAIERFKAGYLRQFGAVTGDPLLESVEAGRVFPGMEHWLPLFHPDLVPLTAYLDAGGRDRPRPPGARRDQGPRRPDRRALRGAPAAAAGRHQLRRRTLPRAAAGAALSRRGRGRARAGRAAPGCEFSTFGPPPRAARRDRPGRGPGRPCRRAISRPSAPTARSTCSMPSWRYLDELVAAGERPLIAAYSEGTAERLRQVLADHGFDRLTRVERWADVPEVGGAAIAVLPLERGFTAPAIHVIGERDLLGDRLTAAAKRTRKAADKFVQDIAALSEGDLVVHAEHGIGRFEGLETLRDRRCAARLPEAGLPGRRQAVRAGREPGRALALRPCRPGGDARPAGRRRLAVAQGQGQGAHPRAGGRADQGRGRAGDAQGHGARPAARRLRGVRRPLPLRGDRGPAGGDRGRARGHGLGPADGPAALRRCRLRQDRGGAARRVRRRHGRQAGGAAGADHAAGPAALPRVRASASRACRSAWRTLSRFVTAKEATEVKKGLADGQVDIVDRHPRAARQGRRSSRIWASSSSTRSSISASPTRRS